VKRRVESRRRSARLAFITLERRDVPSGGAAGLTGPVPGTDELLSAINPFIAAGRGDEWRQHGGGCNCPLCNTLPADLSKQAWGPFPGPAELPIANTSPGGGPAGPLSPIPVTYSTLSNGMPILNSAPSAPVAIFLDFDGEVVGSTTYTPYDVNGDPATFNAAEQATIYETWRQISIYYAMFDVNVTTIKPVGVPTAWQLISNSISGGYAFVGAFPNSQPQGFNQSSDARTRISGIAHEIGHNFGLSHQSDWDALGNKVNEYSSGFPLHGPIMGVDYAQNVHKFVIGHPSSSASNLQDDLQVIANRIRPYQPPGGDGFKADEHGNTTATATVLVPDAGVYEGWGTIERLTDVDAFSFTSVGGLYGIYGIPSTPSSLDIKLEIFDSANNRLATVDPASVNEANIVMDLPAGTYFVLVSSRGDYGDIGAYQVSMRPLPAGWTSQDIGDVVTGGYAGVEDGGLWRVGGSGSDIGGTSDMFRFAYTNLTGDGSIVARVTNVENTNASAKAGVMIRESTAANSRFAFMALTPTAAIFQSRTSTGGSASSTNGTGAFPFWVRLTRTGNSITGAVSSNGTSWTNVATATVSMGSQVLIGLGVTSRNNSHYNGVNDATFTNVAVTGNTTITPPTLNNLPAPTGLTLSLAAGTGITASWDAVAGAVGYAVDRSNDGVNWTQVGTPTTPTWTDGSLTGSQRYFYRVSARDSGGLRSPASPSASTINRPSAVSNFTLRSLSTTQIVLDWRETVGETGYRIERSIDAGATWTSVGTVGANVPSFTNSGLTAATTYSYRVIPLSPLGDGATSSALTTSTRLAAVTGLTVTSVTSSEVALSWTGVASGATGYRIQRSTDGTTFTTLATVTGTTYTATGLPALTENYFRVAAVNQYSESISQPVVFAATQPASPIAPPWASLDVGAVAGRGAAGLSGSTFTVIGSGSRISSTSDSFHFVYQPLTGDGTLVARVNAHEATTNAGAGILIRESLSSNSRVAYVGVTPTSGLNFVRRTSNGGTASSTNVAGIAAPEWLRLQRVGNVFTASYSEDGVTWTQAGTAATITMAGSVYAGLGVFSGGTTLLNTTTFTNVTLTQAVQPPRVVDASPTGNVPGPVTGVTLNFTKPMDQSSFSVAQDLVAFTGPAGNLAGEVTGFSWLTPTSLRINFESQVVPGAYTLSVGPNILDTGGVPLDQNNNGTPGQAADGFTVSFSIGRAVDGFGYAWAPVDYDPALNFEPTAPGAVIMTTLSNTDDLAVAVDLGSNSFRYYNAAYSGANQLFVSSNGLLTFGAGSTDYTNLDLSSTPGVPAIAALWDDLVTNRNSVTDDVVSYQFVDLNGDSVPDRLNINWRNVHYFVQQPTSGDDGITFQVSLELNTGARPGDIVINYTDLNEVGTAGADAGFSATVGIKDSGIQGLNRVLISQDGSGSEFVASNKAVRLFINQAPTANAGGPYVLGPDGTVTLSGLQSVDPNQSSSSLFYLWDLDGDGVFGESGAAAMRGAENVANPVFSGVGLSGPQNYPIAVRVIDDFGIVSTANGVVAIPGPPTVAGVTVNDGSPQRSRVNRLVVEFDRRVNLPANPATAFTLSGSLSSIPMTATVDNSGPATRVTLNFTTLFDDQYTLTTLAGQVTDLIGQAMATNSTYQFHSLFGDSNGDGMITATDFIAFRLAFLSGDFAFDINSDGQVNSIDFMAFRLRFLQGI
jgi:regulation of enolase protein 1 (concanavalin A-like superfamily)